jgi:hypothetical protein
LHPTGEDEPRCPICGEDLFNQPVVLIDTAAVGESSHGVPWREAIGDAARRIFSPPSTPPVVLARVFPGGRGASQTLVMTRVIGLAPEVTEAALDGWWEAHAARAVVDLGHDHLKLGPPAGRPIGGLRRMPADLHRWSGWPEHLELELNPWSLSQTELSLRPRRRLHNLARYFRTGQAILDRMAAELCAYSLQLGEGKGARSRIV